MGTNKTANHSIVVIGIGFITKNYIDYCLKNTTHKLIIITSKKNYFFNKSCLNRMDFIYTDYIPSNTFQKEFEKLQTDILLLAGWNTNNIYSEDINKKEVISNVDFNIWLVNLFIKNGGKYILGLGSCAEYLPSIRCSESNLDLFTSTNYSQEKICLQRRLMDIKSKHNINFGWLRIFAPYGKYEKKESLIFKLLKSTLHGNICNCIRSERKRDYIYVNDIIEIINLMIKKNFDGVLNGGNGNAKTIYDLIEIFQKTFDREPCINWLEKNNLENHQLFNSSWVSNPQKLFKSLTEYKPTELKESLIIYSKEIIKN